MVCMQRYSGEVLQACDGLISGNDTFESSLGSIRSYGRLASCSSGADVAGDTYGALAAELIDAVGGSVRLPLIATQAKTPSRTSDAYYDLAEIQPLPSPSPEPLGVTALLAELEEIGGERAAVRSLAATPEFLAEEIRRVEERMRDDPAAAQNRSAAQCVAREQRAAAMRAAQQSFLPRLITAEAFFQRAAPRRCELASMRKAVREDGLAESLQRTTLRGGFAWSRKAVDRGRDEGSSLGWRVARTGAEPVALHRRSIGG